MSGIPLPLSRPSKDFRFDPERRFSKERLNAIKRDLDREISSSRNLLPEPEMTTEGEVGLTTSDIARLEEALVAELNAAEKENNIVTSERTFDYVSSEAKIEEAIVSEGPHQNANFAFEKSKDSTNDVGRKATIDLSQGWPAPITRSSGQPREPFSPYLTQATAQDSSIKTEHASIANFSSQRPTRDASLPPLIEDDGSETAQGSRQTSADIADDEALAKALVADEYHADETWDRDWVYILPNTELVKLCERATDFNRSLTSRPPCLKNATRGSLRLQKQRHLTVKTTRVSSSFNRRTRAQMIICAFSKLRQSWSGRNILTLTRGTASLSMK